MMFNSILNVQRGWREEKTHKLKIGQRVYFCLMYSFLMSISLLFPDLVVHNELWMDKEAYMHTNKRTVNLLLPHVFHFLVSNPLAFLDLVVHDELWIFVEDGILANCQGREFLQGLVWVDVVWCGLHQSVRFLDNSPYVYCISMVIEILEKDGWRVNIETVTGKETRK